MRSMIRSHLTVTQT